MDAIKKLNMVIIMAHQFEETVAFYQKLGLVLKFHLKNQWAEFALGDVKVGICPTSTIEENKRTGIVLEVENLAQAHKSFSEQGIPFSGDLVQRIHGAMITMKDPSGNLIDLYQPTPEQVKDLVLKVAREESQRVCCGKKGNCCNAMA
jgi:catechol 2,3-dioxygenase-like lactoylglutathione lyase family enzyme